MELHQDQPSIISAVLRNDVAGIKANFDHVNEQDGLGKTALHHAMENPASCEELVKLLLSCDKTNVNIPDKFGRSCLLVATKQCSVLVVTLLLSAGANPNLCDMKKQSPLHFAAQRGDAEVVSALLQAGADPTWRNCDGQIPMELAQTSAVQSVLTDALVGRDVEAKPSTIKTADPSSAQAVTIKKLNPSNKKKMSINIKTKIKN